MERRIFTITDANRAIPRLSRLLEMIQQRYRWLTQNRQQIPYLVAQYNIVNEGPVNPEYFGKLLSLRKVLKEIQKSGAQVKDINTGLVDFPSRLFGRDVLLCWRLGEEEVRFWHDPEAGFAGRQPLPVSESKPETEGEGN